MKISIIIPVYNVGELLRKSVESVLEQIQDDCEIIIVNDGSTDNSGAICDEYSSIANVHVIHKKNGGLSSARNAGIDSAKGEYLLFLDSDDYLRPGSIALLSNLINDSGEFDFIQFRYDEVLDYSDNRMVENANDLHETIDRRSMFEHKLMLGGIGASACTKLIRRDVCANIRFKEGIIHEDEQFTTLLINQSRRVIYISNPLYMYVQRTGSIITSGFSKKRLDIIPVLEEQISILNSNGFYDLAQKVRNDLFTNLCIMYVDARKIRMHDCVAEIKNKANRIIKDVRPNKGTIGIIAGGMKLHLPMMQLYYFYKTIRNGKA